jgi:hypothetical protein
VREEKYRSAEAALPVTSFDSCNCNSNVYAVEFDAEIGNLVCPVATAVSSGVLADDQYSPIGVAKTIAAENVTDSLILGGSTLPASLQGIFWLTNQKTSSAAMSFGGPSNDGGGSSTGRLSDDGQYDIRVAGDRVWSFATEGPMTAAANQDLVYHFEFDDRDAPTHASIVPSFEVCIGLFCRRVPVPSQGMDFQATLADPGEFDELYPGSVVWKRNSYILGREIESAYYDLVQVVDGGGNHIEPAWSLYVHEQTESPGWENSSPGMIFYHEIE